jgi:hypothetical protein
MSVYPFNIHNSGRDFFFAAALSNKDVKSVVALIQIPLFLFIFQTKKRIKFTSGTRTWHGVSSRFSNSQNPHSRTFL